ncbi:MAG: C40 family peptidase [Spirochaetales bacterium]|nr:C40 family peptidase [Spirochaetales bacterium]
MNIWKFAPKSIQLLVLIFFLSSCVTLTNDPAYKNESFKESSNSKQDLIVKIAIESTQKGYPSTLKFNNKNFTNDCSGLIYGIFWEAGIDLIQLSSLETGNGVSRIYKTLYKKGFIHYKKLPNPGDLIFWNNTYGSWGNNPLSHIGIVVSVDAATGQVDYVHNNTYLGQIRRESMNLYRPHETRPINNYMRYDSKYKKTSAELFDSFGMAWKL